MALDKSSQTLYAVVYVRPSEDEAHAEQDQYSQRRCQRTGDGASPDQRNHEERAWE